MTVGVIGSGRIGPRLAAMLAAGALPAGTGIAAWAPSGADHAPPPWVEALGVPVVEDPLSLIGRADGIVVDLAADPHWHRREVLSEAAAEAGKAILVDAPLADFVQVYDRIRAAQVRGQGRLLSVRPLRRRLAVQTALGIAAADLGEILAVYGSLHLPTDGAESAPPPSFEQSVFDLLDVVMSLLGSPLARLYAAGQTALQGRGGSGEAVHVLARTEGGTVVSLDVNRALPASLGSRGEAIFEVTGQTGFVRIAPDAADVTVATQGGIHRIPWREDAVSDAIGDWLHGAADTASDPDTDRLAITALRMVKRARALAKVVGPDGNPVPPAASPTPTPAPVP